MILSHFWTKKFKKNWFESLWFWYQIKRCQTFLCLPLAHNSKVIKTWSWQWFNLELYVFTQNLKIIASSNRLQAPQLALQFRTTSTVPQVPSVLLANSPQKVAANVAALFTLDVLVIIVRGQVLDLVEQRQLYTGPGVGQGLFTGPADKNG